MNNIDESGERFVAQLRDRFAKIDAEPEWLESPTGITVVEHTGMHELDEETQSQFMRLYEYLEMNGKNKLFD